MAPIALHTALDTPPDEHRTAADCFSVASGDNFRPPKRRRNGRRFPISSAPVFRVPRRRDRGLVDGTHPLPDSTSAIRVCQPGPVAFQLAITSGGSRNDRSLRGFCNFGRPPRERVSLPDTQMPHANHESWLSIVQAVVCWLCACRDHAPAACAPASCGRR